MKENMNKNKKENFNNMYKNSGTINIDKIFKNNITNNYFKLRN